MPKVTVIIPTFNSARVIKRAVESVLDQTYRDFEILIVDDGSSDSTLSEARSFSSDKVIRIIEQNNKGPSSARNKGIAESKGEFISFLDSDDIYLANRIEEGVRVLDANKRIDIVYSNEIFFLEDSPEKDVESPHPKFSGDIFFYLKRSNFIHTSTVMARGSLFNRWHFDESLKNHEDWDLFLRASKEGTRFCYMPKPLVKVSLCRGSLTYTSKGWSESRRIVGERAKREWRDLKKKDFFRYLRLKTKAVLIGFPGHPRFNKRMPHDLLKA
ncbi:MAG: glycosyltransferase [Candidatus Omnitrophica bacterium]|nr:glycosyltransferase [Candidatus Omnitrophota bacterium]